MNQHLETLLSFIQQSKDLSASERNKISKEVKKIEEEILRKSRDLEIEASLERVRVVAMSMKQPADMIEICRIISKRLQMLNVKNLRNVQTAIIDESKGIYSHYEYYTLYNKSSVSEVKYNEHPKVLAFVKKMRKASNAFFTTTFKVAELKKWRNHRKDQNLVPDPKLDEVDLIYYYYYSIGPGALGVSTYVTLKKEEINLFKRFRNVFDLAYKRYTDIEKAEEQTREAQIETSLEKVRAQAIGMKKPEDLPRVCEVLYSELRHLGFGEIRNAMVNIHNDEKKTFVNYDYSDEIGKSITPLYYDIHPVIKKQIKQIRSADDAFSETVFKGKDLQSWKAFRRSRGEKDDKRIKNIKALYYYFYSIGSGSIGISTFNAIGNEKLQLLKRFRNVFAFAYRRYMDVAQAEAQAREAQIELALERVRARTMAMHRSDELSETSLLLFQQFKDLGETSEQISIGIFNEDKNIMELYSTLYGSQWKEPAKVDLDEPVVMKKIHAAWKEPKKSFVIDLAGNELLRYNAYRKKLSNLEYRENRWVIHIAFFSKGVLTFSATNPHPNETVQLLERFASVFEGTYTRFLDLQKAEAQVREAKIEAALERVRSKAMAMHKSDDLNDAVAIVFEELDKLNIGMLRCGIGILSKEKRCADVFTTTIAEEGRTVQVSGDESMDIHPLLHNAYEAWLRNEDDFSYQMEGQEILDYYYALTTTNFHLPESQQVLSERKGYKQFTYHANFQSGALFAFRDSPFPDEAKSVMKRFAGVFNLTYQRFLDIQKAEAQAIEAQLQKQLIETKHREITENISYALRIQTAILPAEKLVKEFLPDSFMLYLPKDVVAGDFYWMARVDDVILFSANDCTGHGVSGAMVSVICHNALNTAIREYNLTQPSLILDKVAELVEENFTQSEDKIQDGMDTSLCAYFPQQCKLQWAGANNPLWIVRNNELIEYKPDKQPIGKYENRKPYTNHEIELLHGDNIYIFSDGYQDQFGGEKGKKLTKKGLKNILLSIQNKNMQEQYEALFNYHHRWKGSEEQVDDICVMGIRV